MINVERLRQALTDRAFSQAELARRAGVSPAAIQQLMNGSVKRTRALPEIAAALGVSSDWLETRSDEKGVGGPALGNAHQIYRLRYIHALAEIGALDRGEPIADKMIIDRKWLRAISGGVQPENLTMVRTAVSDMAPNIMPGDDILLDLEAEYDGNQEDIWVATYKDRVLCRRFRELDPETLIAIADNPLIPDLRFKPSEMGLVGRVVWHARRLQTPEA